MSGRCTDSYCDNMSPSHRCDERELAPVRDKSLSEYSISELRMAIAEKHKVEQEKTLREKQKRLARIAELKAELKLLEETQ